MTADPVFEAELRAMKRLGWTASDLHAATFQYGDVGSVHDVVEHLKTGNHLPHEKKAYIAAALWDAELVAVEEAAAGADEVEPTG